MKINIITYSNYPFGGASANFVRLLARGLFENGNEVKVILPTGHYFGNNKQTLEKKINNYEGITYQYLGFINHPKNTFGKLIDLLLGFVLPIFHLLSRRNKSDIIILYHVSLTTVLPYIIIRILSKQKLFYVLPEFYEKPCLRFYKPQMLNWYNFYFGIKYLLGKADGFIVLTRYLMNFINQNYRGHKPILIVPNLIDPDLFNFIPSNPQPADVITIGYIGTPTRKDGVDTLIESFAILSKKYGTLRLLIIGDITNGKTIIPHLKQKTKNLGIDKIVSFTGLIDYKKVPELLLQCNILALTRPNGIFAEAGFPSKLGEYFATKKPVLVTNVGDIPYYFSNGGELIIAEAEEINKIVEGFEKIILNLNEANHMGNRGYQWMMENLHYKKVTYKVSQFLDSFIQNNQ